MHINCPHCHNGIEVVEDASLVEVDCPSCGSQFSLIDADPSDDFETLPGGHATQTLGRFELVNEVGKGAFGSVWRGKDPRLDRVVAIKVPRKGQLNKAESEQFFREARAAAQLKHPNIVPVHEIGKDGETIYIVSDFVQGVTLADRLTARPMGMRESAELCIKVCRALHHAHEKGVVHRDLKPANIMLDDQGEPHVMDFGLAKREAGEITMTMDGQILGTPAYMSPEQARGSAHDADGRSDLYSVGVILFQLLTGELPFRGNTRMLIHQVINDDAPNPLKLNSNIDKDLATITTKCLEKESDKRYESSDDLADDLQRYLDGEPISACPISNFERGWRWCKRKPALSGALAVSVTLLLILAIGGPIVAVQQAALKQQADDATAEVERERDRANLNENEANAALEQSEATLARSNYFLAIVRWRENRARVAKELLESVPVRFRQFEWHLARRHFEGGYMTCYGHLGPVSSVAASPDGSLVVSGSYDNTLKLWDSATGEELRTFTGHAKQVYTVAFSPDGERIASGSYDGTTRLWDVATGEELNVINSNSHVLAFSPDGSQLATQHPTKRGLRIKLWDTASGEEQLTISSDKMYARTNLEFSPDGAQIITGNQDNRLTLFDAKTGEEIWTTEGFHHAPVSCVTFSPDGTRVVSGGRDNSLMLWDAKTGKYLWRFEGHWESISSVAFNPDGSQFVSGSHDGTLKLWDYYTGDEQRTLVGHTDLVSSVSFSPNGSRIISGSSDNTVKQWDVEAGEELRTIDAHTRNVYGVGITSDGKSIVSGSFDGALKLWDLANGEERRVFEGHAAGVNCIALHSNGTRIVSGSDDNTLKNWNISTGEVLRTFDRHTAPINCVAVSSDGKQVVSGSDDNTLRLWNLETGELLRKFNGQSKGVRCVAFSPNDERIVSGSLDGKLRLWNVKTGNEIRELVGHGRFIRCVSFSPNGERIVSGSNDKTLKLWDSKSGNPIHSLKGHQSDVSCATFSPDSERIVSGSWDHSLKIWDTESGDELRTLTGHEHNVYCVAFSPDGERIVSGSHDTTLKIWDATIGAETRRFKGHTDRVLETAFSSDERQIYSRTSKEKIAWDVLTGERTELEQWPDETDNRISGDGRWLVGSTSKDVLLIDLEFRNRPIEKALREMKSKLSPDWHHERAVESETKDKWYAALFHWAWVMKSDPERADVYDRLHASHDKLQLKYNEQNKEVSDVLAPIVNAMLQLPRGKELPILSAEEASAINNETWEKVKSVIANDKLSSVGDIELERFRNLVIQHPRGIYFNTLAFAEFRSGNFEEAITASLKSGELTPEELNLSGPHPGDLAVLAMSHFKLENLVRAKEYRDKFDEAMKLDAFNGDEECNSFAEEVAKLFDSNSEPIED